MTRAPSLARRQGQVASFLADWIASLHCTTATNYALDLDMYARWQLCTPIVGTCRMLRGGRGPANATVLRWRTAMRAHGYAPATVERRVAALRALVRRARLVGLIEWALDVRCERVVPLRDTRGPGRAAFEAAVATLGLQSGYSAHTNLDPHAHRERRWSEKGARIERGCNWRAARDLALLRCLHDLALRMSEVLSLDLAHLELDRGSIWVLRKRARERCLLTMPPETSSVFCTWIEARGSEPGPLFCTRWRHQLHRMTPRAVQHLVHRLGLGHPHGLRHLGITEALDYTGGDIRKVGRFSGHVDINNVLRYDDVRRDIAGEVARLVAAPPAR